MTPLGSLPVGHILTADPRMGGVLSLWPPGTMISLGASEYDLSSESQCPILRRPSVFSASSYLLSVTPLLSLGPYTQALIFLQEGVKTSA